MKIVIADTGALLSLGHVGCIDLIEKVFGDFYIAWAVWQELNDYDHPEFDKNALKELETRVVKIKSKNYLLMVMDYGESESVILYEEMGADFLLVDDNKARTLAESLNINCIGSIGLLLKAKQKELITELKPIFEKWISTGRYFSKNLLNKILLEVGETSIDEK